MAKWPKISGGAALAACGTTSCARTHEMEVQRVDLLLLSTEHGSTPPTALVLLSLHPRKPFVSACADGLHCIAVARVPRAQEKRPTRASEGIQLLLLLLVAINVHLLTSARYSGCLGTMAAALGEERWRPGEPCGLARSLGRSLRLSTSSSFIARAGACLQRLRSSSAGGGRFLSAAAVVAVLPAALVGLSSTLETAVSALKTALNFVIK